MKTFQEIEDMAEQSALEDNEYCTPDNHEHDCPCGAHEDGFRKGYKKALEETISIEELKEFADRFRDVCEDAAWDYIKELNKTI